MRHLCVLFTHLRRANLKVELPKCQFQMNVQMCQIGRNCRKKVTLDQMSKLRTKEEVQQFLGLHGRILPDIEPSLLYLHMIRKVHL